MTAIRARGLTVHAGPQRLAGPVDFELAAGASLGLWGPSGSGKSTLLRALVGLLPPALTTSGTAGVLGQEVVRDQPSAAVLARLRSRVVLVGQTPVVFPGSILDNAMFGLRHVVRGRRATLVSRATAALREAGLWDEVADRLDAPADVLSAGQRQRLCLARALALDPAVLLLDEPTSSLDQSARATVELALARLRGTRTILLVSHDPEQMTSLCDDIVELACGQAGRAEVRSPRLRKHR